MFGTRKDVDGALIGELAGRRNVELWQALDEANGRHKVKWHWVRGHAGHAENERAE